MLEPKDIAKLINEDMNTNAPTTPSQLVSQALFHEPMPPTLYYAARKIRSFALGIGAAPEMIAKALQFLQRIWPEIESGWRPDPAAIGTSEWSASQIYSQVFLHTGFDVVKFEEAVAQIREFCATNNCNAKVTEAAIEFARKHPVSGNWIFEQASNHI